MHKFFVYLICLATNLMAAEVILAPFTGTTVTSIIKPFKGDEEQIEIYLHLKEGFTTDHPLLVRPDASMEITLTDTRPVTLAMLVDDHPDSIRRIIKLRALSDLNAFLAFKRAENVTISSQASLVVTILTRCHMRLSAGTPIKASSAVSVRCQGTWHEAPFPFPGGEEEIETRYAKNISPSFTGRFIVGVADLPDRGLFTVTMENGALSIVVE